ncbi:polyphosphate polymerase domain-containing protein [bacterium]|nr:polyphosphate polymerase domain-containing protein [bacterium]MCP5462753.1 polyphosphate polymerase domain-containing protein [bacterium]
MSVPVTTAKTFRYERKFAIQEYDIRHVESLVKLHPAHFSEIYHERYINNIYFDSRDLENYFGNVDGDDTRRKIRIRWYGDFYGNIEKPVLEIKHKRGLLGTKESFELPAFTLDETTSAVCIQDSIKRSLAPQILKNDVQRLEPTLVNRYKRKYFLSLDGIFRITIDSGILFHRMYAYHNNFLEQYRDSSGIILELKYDQEHDECAHSISTHFPFRLSRNSKYIAGIDCLYNAVY